MKNTRNLEIITTRLIDAPRSLVWKAWTDPYYLKDWWGPHGFTNTFHTFELKPLGYWDFTMHGPDGTNYHNTSQFTTIVLTEKLEFDHLKPLHKFKVITTFEAIGNKTQLTFRMIHPTEEEYQRVIDFVPAANEENFDRLEAVLKKMI